ncbi:hypothetical protein TPY_0834 [Sulfobacillus acidophilus TPY]|uniref:Uncharacterized protein n=1 Tax=Sulfobacillus acidophilus (strain ATCC 700253 / DSM 10332 / NAL) TaxID=679936 RepID=G8TYK7_SULAD|nr:hypothetical protein TPY_0834 [Sulfobacillus acidophilus TPY]AEW06268.1 hypothetical protein Sulac_2807 [Sulfobacillus acidophilus DSM 10332]
MKAKHSDQKRADYYLYTWQIREVQRIARETKTPPSEVVRQLLAQALSRRDPPSPSPEWTGHTEP